MVKVCKELRVKEGMNRQIDVALGERPDELLQAKPGGCRFDRIRR